MAYSGLGEMSRRRRLATFLDEEVGRYFYGDTVPALKHMVGQLKEAGIIPPNLTFDEIWSAARAHERYKGNIVLSDERAFLCPPLNKAHQSGDMRALAREFIDLIAPAAIPKANQNERDLAPHIEAICIAGATLDRLGQSSKLVKLARRLCDHFTHTYPNTIVKTLAPNFAVLTALGYKPVNGTELSLDDINAISANPTAIQKALAHHFPNDAAEQFMAWLDAQETALPAPEATT